MNAFFRCMSWEGFISVFTLIGDFVVNSFFVALIILFLGFIIGRLVGKFIKKLLSDFDVDSLMRNALDVRFPLTDVISAVVTYLVYFVAVVMALDMLGVATQVLTVISLGVIALLVVLIILGIKDFIPNAIAGLSLHSRKFVAVGDVISVDTMRGRVAAITLVETQIKTSSGDLICIPNSYLMRHAVRKHVSRVGLAKSSKKAKRG